MNNISSAILNVENLTINRGCENLLEGISFCLQPGDNLAIVGPSGSGKTLLGLSLAGEIFFRGKIEFPGRQHIVWVEQQHHFKNLQHTDDLYYQQRFNSYDTEETPTVMESLGDDSAEADALFKEMGMEYLKNERLIQLSNGENKKLQLLKAQLEKPTVLILDQPFTGLDRRTQEYLQNQLRVIAGKGVLVILITSPQHLPEGISKVLLLENGKMKAFENRETFLKQHVPGKTVKKYSIGDLNKFLKPENSLVSCDSVIEMKDVTVEYGGKKILDTIQWRVMNGERWLLSGPNGAGKSTLLSLITADNPKAYANDIFLFGKRRGSGESIWDIKRKIGFLSPELHLYFNQYSTCFETVASGLFDTIGLFRQLSDDDVDLVNQWMEFAGISHISQKQLHTLSLGEQRVILLIRALVKNPPLLVLDEPCQGLDDKRRDEFLELINEVCIAGNKTMIFVSHYENEIPACITNFIRLENGKVADIK